MRNKKKGRCLNLHKIEAIGWWLYITFSLSLYLLSQHLCQQKLFSMSKLPGLDGIFYDHLNYTENFLNLASLSHQTFLSLSLLFTPDSNKNLIFFFIFMTSLVICIQYPLSYDIFMSWSSFLAKFISLSLFAVPD